LNQPIFVPDAPSPEARKGLVLISKLLQNLANGTEFTGKDEYSLAMNEFISTHIFLTYELFAELAVSNYKNSSSLSLC
jgi:hypothetical protein